MQALKGLVIFMGILIAVGITVVGVTIYRRATDQMSTDKAAPAAIPPAVGVGAGSAGGGTAGSVQRFGVRVLDLPAGSEIVSVQVLDGGVLVHARLPGGATRLLVLDPASGDVRGEWRTDMERGGATPP